MIQPKEPVTWKMFMPLEPEQKAQKPKRMRPRKVIAAEVDALMQALMKRNERA